MKRKLWSLFLTAAIMGTIIPIPSAFAEEYVPEPTQEYAEESEMPTDAVDEYPDDTEAGTVSDVTDEELSVLDTEVSLNSTTYYISTAEDLANISNDLSGVYFLQNDIDLSSYGEWTPIGTGTGNGQYFSGVFDGQGHTIKGISMSGSGYTYSGLFGVSSGTIKNVNVEIDIIDANTAGGLVGYLNGGTVTTSSSSGSIEGQNDIGGLVGNSYNASITNTYSTANVTSISASEGDGCGGLVGELYARYGSSRITCSYAVGKVVKTGTTGLGGIIGYRNNSTSGSTSVTASYYNMSTTKQGDETRGFGVTSTAMRQKATYANWDFDNIWGIDSDINNGWPYLKLIGEYNSFVLEGSGSKGDPYIINTEAELAAVARGEITNSFSSYYQLANDITLTSNYWTPIGGNGMDEFSGVFDGGGHTVYGLDIAFPAYTYEGLFGEVTGEIKNVNVVSTISDAYTAGGLVGYLNGGRINCSSSSGDINGINDIGGLVGYSHNASIKNSYSTANVISTSTSEGDGCGGLIGELQARYGSSYIACSYAAGKVVKTGTTGLGGIIGYRNNSTSGNTSITASYYNMSTTKQGDETRGFGVTSTAMRQRATFANWDFDNIWDINSSVNGGYPYLKLTGEYNSFELEGSGTSRDPYMIYTEAELAAVARGEITNNFTAYYQLGSDITLTSDYWTPIGGNGMDAFSGVFDGGGHTVYGLDIAFPAYTYEGLFGEVTGELKNVNVVSTISDAHTAGGLVGYLNGGRINCSSSSGDINGINDIGGLVGYSHNASIKNSYSTANVISISTSEGDGCGGLIGELQARYGSSYIACSYAAGKVVKTGTTGLGGIVGYRNNSTSGSTSITASYYDTDTTGMADTARGFGVSSSAMKSMITYANWNFDNIWAISASVNNGYPYLKLTGEYNSFELEGSGTSRDPYVIYTEAELAAVARGEITNNFTAYYKLGSDIYLTSDYWTPIGGNGMDAFSGEFDGNGHTVYGLSIIANGYQYSGLFGDVSGTVKNLRIVGKLENVSAAGLLTASMSGTVDACCSEGSVSGQGDTGGLIGYAYNAKISNCWSSADVMNSSTASGDGCGGLVGEIQARYGECNVTYSYARGHLTKSGGSNTGGLIGYKNTGSSGTNTVMSCYFDNYNDTSTDKGTYKTTEEMKQQSTYAVWDFDTVWAIGTDVNDGYPYLRVFASNDTVPVTGISLNKTSTSLNIGENETITATITPANASNTAVIWASSDASVADIAGGTITAKAQGTALITARTVDGGYTAICTVTVSGEASTSTPTPAPTPSPTPTINPAEVTGIMITSQPTNTTIVEGMPLDVTGLEVSAISDSGAVIPVSSYTLSGYDPNHIGEQTITVEYIEFTASFTVTVVKKSLTGIAITQKPAKRTYTQGEQLDVTGMVVTAYYNNDTTAEITDYTLSGYSADTAGAQPVTVSYGGYTASFSVTVTAASQTGEKAATPRMNISSFIGGKTVTLICATEGASIYYTTDGTVPTSSSTLYTQPIALTETATIKAIAVKSGMSDSSTASGRISVITAETPSSSHASGQLEVGTVVTLQTKTGGAMIYYTTDGSTPTTDSERYTGSIAVTSAMTIKAIAVKSGYISSGVFEVSYTVPEHIPQSVTVSAGSTTAAAGDTVSIPIYMFADENVTSYRFTLSYDSSSFEYVSVSPAEDMASAGLFASTGNGTVTIMYSGDAIESGEMCNINLNALSSATDGNYPVTLGDVSIKTTGSGEYAVEALNGTITLSGSANSLLDVTANAIITDGSGNNVGDGSDISGELIANVTVDDVHCNESVPLTACIMLAIYDRSGALITLSTLEADLSDIDHVFSETIDIPDGVFVGSIKLFIWNGLRDMAPVSEASTVL